MCECGGKCGSACKCHGEGEHQCSCSCSNEDNTKVLFCIVGKSASGKDRLVRALSERLGWKVVCSYAERPMREGETDGVEHRFVSKEEMDKLFDADNVIAKTQIGEYRYCATTDCIDADTKLYIVDPAGVEYLSERQEKLGICIYVVYIDVDEEVRLERALGRGDNIEVLKKRFEAESEMFDAFRDMLLTFESTDFDWGYYRNDENFEEMYALVAGDLLYISR